MTKRSNRPVASSVTASRGLLGRSVQLRAGSRAVATVVAPDADLGMKPRLIGPPQPFASRVAGSDAMTAMGVAKALKLL